MEYKGRQVRYPSAGRQLQSRARCLALSDRHALYVSAERAGSSETARVVLADLASGRVHTAFRRRRVNEALRLAVNQAHEVSVSIQDLGLTLKASQGRLEAYGHVYGFGSADGPLLFDIVMERAQRGAWSAEGFPAPGTGFPQDGDLMAGLSAEGRALTGRREYLFSPAVSLGAMEYLGNPQLKGKRMTRLDAAGWAHGEAVWLSIRAGAENPGSALFLAGKPLAIGAVTFRQERQGGAEGLTPWQIRDGAGRLSLAFKPALETRAKAKLFSPLPPFWLLFGAVSGTIVLESGESRTVTLPAGCLEVQ